jgi:hypothetical protein
MLLKAGDSDLRLVPTNLPLFLIPLLLLLLEEVLRNLRHFFLYQKEWGKKKFISFDFCVIRSQERAEDERS